jgi:hypothetical protein
MAFWTRKPKTSGEEHAKALARSSADWASEIRRLNAEADQLAVEEATVTAKAGRAQLDGHAAKAADLTRRLTEITAERAVLASAITAAQDRQADAERDEERKRLILLIRRHTLMVAEFCRLTAGVVEAQRALDQAKQVKAAGVNRDQITALHAELSAAGFRPETAETVLLSADPGRILAEAERLRRLAETFTLADDGMPTSTGEVIDQAALPPTPKEVEVAAIQHAKDNPPSVTRSDLEALDAELKAVRETARRATEERNADRFTWAAKLEQLTVKRADMAAELEALEGAAA